MATVDLTVTQNGNPPVNGTASWENTNAPYIDGGGGVSSVSDTCVADDINSNTVACGASFQNSGSGTKTTFFHPHNLSQLQTCTEDDPPQFGGDPGTCTYADGSGEANITQTQVIGAGTQPKPSSPVASTCTASDTGTKPQDGSASFGSPYDVGTATTPVTSYTHDGWGAWGPDTDTVAAGTTFKQTRIRTTYESVSASTINQEMLCSGTAPQCGGAVATCSGTAIGSAASAGVRVVSAATGPTEVTPTMDNMGLEERDAVGTMAAAMGWEFDGCFFGNAVCVQVAGGTYTSQTACEVDSMDFCMGGPP